MSLQIHESIMEKLKFFHKTHKIPNIIFHGESGNGKKSVVNQFINLIYNEDKDRIKNYVMYVNCAHGKGIKFIREELKFFAKTHINSNGGDNFKSVILLNADKLTIDAQSALRRCIELFNHTTRFFIIVEDKYKLLKPILSRFCEIYIPEPTIHKKEINLYEHILNKTFNLRESKTQKNEWLKKFIAKNMTIVLTHEKLIGCTTKLYEKGYSGLDLIEYIEKNEINNVTEIKKYELLFTFNKIRKEFRNEKLLILFILNFVFLSLECNLENISFM
jgi:DNA polymerase III delta prime subunit